MPEVAPDDNADEPSQAGEDDVADESLADAGLDDLLDAIHGLDDEIHQDGHRVADADGVGKLNVAPPGQAGGHDVLGHVPGHVGSGAVHLGGVLAGERAAAVGGGAAVGVHNDLPPGEAAVAHGAADDEAAGGIDVEPGVLVDVPGGDDGLHHRLHDGLPEVLDADVGAVLGGDHDGRAAEHLALAVVLHSDLALAVGAQPAQLPALAHGGQAAAEAVGQGDGGGHQLLGLVAGVAEHHALVAGADGLVALAVHAHGDVAALLVDGGHNGAGAGVEAAGGVVIADFVHGAPDDVGDVHVAPGGDLAHDHHHAGGGHGLTGHAAGGVLGHDGVQNGVRNLVADLVGMSLGDGLGCKDTVCHVDSSFLFDAGENEKKHAGRHASERFRFPHLALTAGIGTLLTQVAVASSGRSLRHS